MNSSGSNTSSAGKIRDPDKLTITLFSILLLYFLGKCLYFALNIGVNISPDEITWLGRSLVFSKFLFLPTDSPATYEYGLVTHGPYLYTWLMGKLIHLNFLAVSDLIFLRCINIFIGLATLWYAWKTILMLTDKNITRLLFVVFCTNTLMLTFLNSFVSYDNLTNFFAVISLYFLLAYFQSKSISPLLLCVSFMLAGCLTKLSFLPFAVLVFIVFIIKEFRNVGSLAAEFKSCFLFKDARRSLLMALCLFFLALNLDLYLGNIIKFKAISPPTEAVIGLENAMKNRIFARNYITRQFRENKLSLPEARMMAASSIKHEGDRYSAFVLLNIANQEKQGKGPSRMDRFVYAFPWMDLMLGKTYGIMAHKGMEKRGLALLPFMLTILLAIVVMIRRFSFSDMNGNALILLTVLVGYTLVLMQYVNYNTYDRTGAILLALQGRYLFPVIFAGYALMAHYLTSFKSPRVNFLIAAIVAAVFIAGEFPWFLSHVTADWYFAG